MNNFSQTTGRFITLEGIEGVGKSTQLAFIKNYLISQQIPVTITREPGGTAIAESIRELILSSFQNETLTAEAELLLFFAARAQHIHYVIKPALARGNWVICDRFAEASYAYQGGGRGIDNTFIAALQKNIQKDLKVDCTLLLDAPVTVALARTQQRNQKTDRIEAETQDFFNQVRNVYLTRANENPSNYRIIDAAQTMQKVQAQIKQVLDQFL